MFILVVFSCICIDIRGARLVSAAYNCGSLVTSSTETSRCLYVEREDGWIPNEVIRFLCNRGLTHRTFLGGEYLGLANLSS